MKVRPSRETIGERSRTHGMHRTRFYTIYFSMVQRCNDPKSTGWKIYGGSGIKNLWKSFEEFRDDMHESYLQHVKDYGEKNTQIDRINPKDNYFKANCRWATIKEQARNKRNNHFLTFNGKTQTIGAWAEELGILPTKIATRIYRGWPVQNALSTKNFHRYNSGLII